MLEATEKTAQLPGRAQVQPQWMMDLSRGGVNVSIIAGQEGKEGWKAGSIWSPRSAGTGSIMQEREQWVAFWGEENVWDLALRSIIKW